MSQTLYDRIIEQKGSFERLVARIPGFKGYHEKQARRQANTMIREYIADQLQERINRFVRIEKKILDKTGIRHMNRTRDVKGVIQTYHDRVKTAAPKYDGMWATMKIENAELERIYAFDEAQMRYVDALDDALNAMEQAVSEDADNFAEALDRIYELAVEANEAFKLRDDVITRIADNLL